MPSLSPIPSNTAFLTPRDSLLHAAALPIQMSSRPLILQARRPLAREFHLLCKGFAPVGTTLLLLPSPDGEGAMATAGCGAMAMNADVRAASTAKKTVVDPKKEQLTRTAMRSHDPSSPPVPGLCPRRQQQTIALHRRRRVEATARSTGAH